MKVRHDGADVLVLEDTLGCARVAVFWFLFGVLHIVGFVAWIVRGLEPNDEGWQIALMLLTIPLGLLMFAVGLIGIFAHSVIVLDRGRGSIVEQRSLVFFSRRTERRVADFDAVVRTTSRKGKQVWLEITLRSKENALEPVRLGTDACGKSGEEDIAQTVADFLSISLVGKDEGNSDRDVPVPTGTKST